MFFFATQEFRCMCFVLWALWRKLLSICVCRLDWIFLVNFAYVNVEKRFRIIRKMQLNFLQCLVLRFWHDEVGTNKSRNCIRIIEKKSLISAHISSSTFSMLTQQHKRSQKISMCPAWRKCLPIPNRLWSTTKSKGIQCSSWFQRSYRAICGGRSGL